MALKIKNRLDVIIYSEEDPTRDGQLTLSDAEEALASLERKESIFIQETLNPALNQLESGNEFHLKEYPPLASRSKNQILDWLDKNLAKKDEAPTESQKMLLRIRNQFGDFQYRALALRRAQVLLKKTSLPLVYFRGFDLTREGRLSGSPSGIGAQLPTYKSLPSHIQRQIIEKECSLKPEGGNCNTFLSLREAIDWVPWGKINPVYNDQNQHPHFAPTKEPISTTSADYPYAIVNLATIGEDNMHVEVIDGVRHLDIDVSEAPYFDKNKKYFDPDFAFTPTLDLILNYFLIGKRFDFNDLKVKAGVDISGPQENLRYAIPPPIEKFSGALVKVSKFEAYLALQREAFLKDYFTGVLPVESRSLALLQKARGLFQTQGRTPLYLDFSTDKLIVYNAKSGEIEEFTLGAFDKDMYAESKRFDALEMIIEILQLQEVGAPEHAAQN